MLFKFVYFLNIFVLTLAISPQITIPSGILRGYFDVANNGQKYAAFEGIPYARSPVGKYRFRDPMPIKSWRGIWEADQVHECIQLNHFTEPDNYQIQGEEDCLFINVYTPDLSQTSLLDVIVHIHGGAFSFSSPKLYGPKYMMERKVIYVSFTYRLGPLGFLSTEDEIVPGNNGLKDQIMALKWIKANIQYFGGNPDSITITGLSAGGASVHFHYLSPLSVGLFNRGIAASGVALNPWVMAENSLEKAKRLAASVGCEGVTSRDIVECMKYRPVRQIVGNSRMFKKFLYNPFTTFGPVVEKGSLNPFLPDSPYNLIKANAYQKLPLILTMVKDEGLYPGSEFLSNEKYLPELEARWDELAPIILDYENTVPLNQHVIIAQKIKQHYLSNQPISNNTFPKIIEMLSDRLFKTDIELTAKLHAPSHPVWLMNFAYRGEHSKSKLLSKSLEDLGVDHADDIMYILSNEWAKFTRPEDIQMKDILLEIWTSFAKNGVPLVHNANNLTIDWPPINDVSQLSYLQIDSPTSINVKTTNQSLSNRDFWNTLSFNENLMLVLVRDEL